MKYISKLIIVLIILITTGCTVKYEIEITEDMEVNEQIDVLEKNEMFGNIGTDNKTYIDMMFDVYSTNNKYESYKFDKIFENNKSGIIGTKKFKSLDEYIETGTVKKSMFRFTNIEEENGIITLTSTHFRYDQIFNDLESNFPYDEIRIIINLPFEVTDTNADIKETEKGKYTWIINSNTKTPEIKISFRKKISLEQKIKKYMKNIVIPTLICGAILLVAFIIIFINHKRVNRI